MKNNNSVVCYIPTSLNIENLEGYNKRWHDKYNWFIHSIVFKGLTQKDNFSNTWVNLQSEILRNYIGPKYLPEIIHTLVKNKVIEYNKRYSPGAFSKSYRLSKRYLNTSINAVSIIKPTYERKIKNIRAKYLKNVLSNQLIKSEFRNLTYARIDREKAYEYLNATYPANSKQYKSRQVAIEQYNAMQYAEFSNDRYNINFTFKVHKGRVYSPATMMARDLERFTYFIGFAEQDSAVLDMPNSQLCFYSHLTKTEKNALQLIDNKDINTKVNYIGVVSSYLGGLLDSKDETPIFKNSIIKVAKQPPHKHPYNPYVVNFASNYLNISSWDELIFNSKGYETMMFLSKWQGKNTGHTKQERQDFKAEFFGNLFYNRYQPKLTNLEQVFAEHFPNEFKALRNAKYKYGNKLLAVKVQSLEATFFHKMIVNYMRRNYINIPYVIKHDSIKLPAQYAELIHDDLNKLAREFFSRNDISLKFENV